MDSTGNNMKKKIIKYLKYCFGIILFLTIITLISTVSYMCAFHGNDPISIWPRVENFTNFLWANIIFSGMWFAIFLFIDEIYF